MTDEIIGYFVGIFVFAFIGYMIYSFVYNKKRKEILSRYCQQNGIKYLEDSDYIIDCKEEFDITSRGKDRLYDHIMYGSRNDYEFQLIDFSYTLEKPDPKFPLTTYNEVFNESLCVLHKKGKRLPHFYMLTKSLIQSDVGFVPKVKEYSDVDLLKINDDNETVIVKTRNEDEILDFFDLPRTDAIQPIMKEEFIYEGKGEYLLVSSLNIMSVEERIEMLNSAVKMFEALSIGM